MLMDGPLPPLIRAANPAVRPAPRPKPMQPTDRAWIRIMRTSSLRPAPMALNTPK